MFLGKILNLNHKRKWIEIKSKINHKMGNSANSWRTTWNSAIGILFNKQNHFQTLFVQHNHKPLGIIILNGENGIISSQNTYDSRECKIKSRMRYKRWGFFLNEQFHLIGGYHQYTHLKWNNKTNKFDKINDLGTYCDDIEIMSVIKISRNQLWMICKEPQYNFMIKQYVTEGKWQIKCCLKEIPFLSQDLLRMTCVAVLDQTFLIIIGGDGYWSNTIHVFDIKQQILRKSLIKLPSFCCKMYASSSRNKIEEEMLVFGYCRAIEKRYCNIIYIPTYLKKTIAIWMVMEFIQILCGERGNTIWEINVDDIIKISHS